MKRIVVSIQYLLATVMVASVALTWGKPDGLKDGLILAFVTVTLVRMKIESDEKRAQAERAINDLRISGGPL